MIQEVYGLDSHAAAIRTALYIVQQYGWGPVSDTQSHDARKET